MLRKFVVTAVAALILSPALAMAQQKAGDWEFTLTGNGANNKDFNAGAFNVGGSVGYFFDKYMELSLRQTVGYSDFNAGTSWTGSTRLAFDWHFDLAQWQPFIGGNIGYVYGSGVSDTWEAAPEVGIKYFVLPTTFIFAQAEYQFFFRNGGDVGNGFDDGQFVYGLGIGFDIDGKSMK